MKKKKAKYKGQLFFTSPDGEEIAGNIEFNIRSIAEAKRYLGRKHVSGAVVSCVRLCANTFGAHKAMPWCYCVTAEGVYPVE